MNRPARVINIAEAKAHFSELVERAAGGEVILIGRYNQAVARLVPLEKEPRPIRVPGLGKGKIWIAPDIEAVEREIAKQMEEEPIEPL